MMKPFLFAPLAALLVLPLLAEETPPPAADAVAAEPKKPSSEELKKQLIAAAKKAQQELETSSEDGPYHHLLPNFLHAMERVDAASFNPRTSSATLDNRLPDVDAFRETRELADAFFKQLAVEANDLKIAFEKKHIDAIRMLLKQVLAADDPAKLTEIQEKLTGQYSLASDAAQGGYQYSSLPFLRDASTANQFVSNVARIHTHRNNQSWGEAASMLRDTSSSITRLRRYISADEASAFLAKTRESIGLLPPDKMQQVFKRTLAELLDDANQERLDEIQSAIRTQRNLHNYDSEGGFSRKWQSLDTLATSFVRGVNAVKQGAASQFSAEQWLQSNSDGPIIISKDELIQSLKDYRVRIEGKDGAVVEERLYYDINEVLASIKTPADIERELPALNKAVRQLEYSSGGGNWSVLMNRLQQLAELHAKLSSGTSFQIPSIHHPDYGSREYQRGMSGNDMAQSKADDLNQQLQWMMLQRFFPEIASDQNVSPAQTVTKRFEEANAKGDYSAMLTLHQLSAYFTPGQTLLTPQSSMALQSYLNGLKQEVQLEQPRLATYYYQRAAAAPDGPVPVSELKQRLQGLKQRSPEDYDKGTDDSLKSSPENQAAYYPSTLNVPAKATASQESRGTQE